MVVVIANFNSANSYPCGLYGCGGYRGAAANANAAANSGAGCYPGYGGYGGSAANAAAQQEQEQEEAGDSWNQTFRKKNSISGEF